MYMLRRNNVIPWWRAALGVVGVAALIPAILAAGSASGEEPALRPSRLVQVSRTVAQDQGAWVIDYRLRHTGPTGVIVAPEEIAAKVESWVSNSRVASHAVPRRSSLSVQHGPEFTAICDVIAAVDEAHRCREKLIVTAWAEDQCPCRADRRAATRPRRRRIGAGAGAGVDRDPSRASTATAAPRPYRGRPGRRPGSP